MEHIAFACPANVTKLLDAIDTLAEALEFYAEGKHIMQESEYSPVNVCPPIGSHAREALAQVFGEEGK